jgi:hypothetical protein
MYVLKASHAAYVVICRTLQGALRLLLIREAERFFPCRKESSLDHFQLPCIKLSTSFTTTLSLYLLQKRVLQKSFTAAPFCS